MVPLWWSVVLTLSAVLGTLLLVFKKWQGWLVSIVAQGLWLAYAIDTQQWGFLVSVAVFGTTGIMGLIKWRGERDEAVAIDNGL